jgi:hypothetical protein
MGVLTPLSEQLTKPLPHAIALVNLDELSSGAHKLLPQGSDLNYYYVVVCDPFFFDFRVFSILFA